MKPKNGWLGALCFLLVGAMLLPTLRKTDASAFSESALHEYITQHASDYGHDPDLIFALVDVESDSRNIVSPKGAVGPLQVLPRTARDVCEWPRATGAKMLDDWKRTVGCGMRVLRVKQNRHGWFEGIGRYNGGRRNWQFVRKVLNEYHRRKSKDYQSATRFTVR